MNIVLNENEWAENMIKTKTLGKEPFETLCRVARYYIDKNYNKKNARVILDSFVIQCDPTTSLVQWSDTLDVALKKAIKTPSLKVDYIDITAPEMDKINKLDSTQLRRLAFTLLCLAKYWNLKKPGKDSWVSNDESEIMKLANISTSTKRRCELIRALSEAGYISLSKKVDNTSVRVCFEEEGDVVMKVYDFRNLGYQYLRYIGEPIYECQNCGIVTKVKNPNKGRPPKYCCECSKEIKSMQDYAAVRRLRDRYILQ